MMLTPLLVIPLLGAIAIALLPMRSSRLIASMTSFLSLGWSFVLLSQFDLNLADLQFVE
jgi:NADH:ubiquinone oxidoreductase subunit 4 (subunit M)